MLDKLRRLRKEYLKNVHDVTLYPYQEVISDRIILALLENLRITAGATEEDIKRLHRHEIHIEISRQAGKTTAVVHTIDFILVFLTRHFRRQLAIGIFAPQKEQAKTDFDRLKVALKRSSPLWLNSEPLGDDDAEWGKYYQEQSNSNTIVLPDGSSCYIFPVTKTSKPESKSLDVIVFEESQDLEDKIVKEQIWPMGANTNAPMVYIGTAGTRICYFYRLGQNPESIKLYFDQIASQRRQIYEETGDVRHLVYERTIDQEIEKHGRESDEIARPYFGKWLIGTGQFVTQEDLDKLQSERKETFHDKQTPCFVGIDTAKNPDSTVITILRYNTSEKVKEVIRWGELRGENYQSQFDVIKNLLENYNVVAIAIDSTGQGDFMPDMFQAHTNWRDENSGLYRVKFSSVSKDNMYKNLKVTIKELLTTLPKLDTKVGEKFKLQMLDLQQEYKGQLLSVHHPDASDAHDDYPDSWALAEWAYAKYNENQAEISFIQYIDPNERAVTYDDSGKVTDYWPGLS